MFERYNPDKSAVNEHGEPYITKEQMRLFIKEIMETAGEGDAWNEDKFEESYVTFDIDGSGQIEAPEFAAFVKRFADL